MNEAEHLQLPKDPKQLKLDEAEPDNEGGTTPKMAPPSNTTKVRGVQYHGYHPLKRIAATWQRVNKEAN